MASKNGKTVSKRTDVFFENDEVAVRARSQHSRDAHVPKTDDDGDVIFIDGSPKPACGVTPNTDTEWILRPIGSVANRGKCRRCFESGDVAEQNKANGGSKTVARMLRYGDDWGDETSSGNETHTKRE
jgi:hypothetical protein